MSSSAGTRRRSDAHGSVAATPLPPGRWRLQREGSAVGFRLRHLMLVPVSGRFTGFAASLEVAPDGAVKASGSVDVASLETGDEVRDERLLSPDYFDAARHPRIVFAADEIEVVKGHKLLIRGELTIRGTTRPVELTAWLRSVDAERIELEIEGALSRSAFGIESAQLLDAGISDRIELRIAASLLPDAP